METLKSCVLNLLNQMYKIWEIRCNHARRTYSLRMAHFWDAYLLAKKLQVWQSAKICLTMAKLASASSGAVPIGTSNYLPDESGLPPSTTGFLLAPSAPNSPGHRTCGQDLSSATPQAKNHKKRFRSTVELHHLNRTLQRERVPPRQDRLHRPEKCTEPIVVTIIIVPRSDYGTKDPGFWD